MMKSTLCLAIAALTLAPLTLLADHHEESEIPKAPTPGGDPPAKSGEDHDPKGKLEGGRPGGPPPEGRPSGPPPGGPEGRRGGGLMGGGNVFTEGDTDGDGAISKEEFVAFQVKRSEKIFTMLDKNEDGKVTKEEAMEGMRAMGAMRGGPSGRRGGADARGGGPKRPGAGGTEEKTEDPLEGLE